MSFHIECYVYAIHLCERVCSIYSIIASSNLKCVGSVGGGGGCRWMLLSFIITHQSYFLDVKFCIHSRTFAFIILNGMEICECVRRSKFPHSIIHAVYLQLPSVNPVCGVLSAMVALFSRAVAPETNEERRNKYSVFIGHKECGSQPSTNSQSKIYYIIRGRRVVVGYRQSIMCNVYTYTPLSFSLTNSHVFGRLLPRTK